MLLRLTCLDEYLYKTGFEAHVNKHYSHSLLLTLRMTLGGRNPQDQNPNYSPFTAKRVF